MPREGGELLSLSHGVEDLTGSLSTIGCDRMIVMVMAKIHGVLVYNVNVPCLGGAFYLRSYSVLILN